MTTKIRIELEQAFKAECKVIDLKHEYTGYRENIRWAIATALTETALRSKYSEIIAQYEPFLLLTEEHAKIFVQFHSNERKHKMRNLVVKTKYILPYEKGLQFAAGSFCRSQKSYICGDYKF